MLYSYISFDFLEKVSGAGYSDTKRIVSFSSVPILLGSHGFFGSVYVGFCVRVPTFQFSAANILLGLGG
jgi:hypothetical protein